MHPAGFPVPFQPSIRYLPINYSVFPHNPPSPKIRLIRIVIAGNFGNQFTYYIHMFIFSAPRGVGAGLFVTWNAQDHSCLRMRPFLGISSHHSWASSHVGEATSSPPQVFISPVWGQSDLILVPPLSPEPSVAARQIHARS